MMKESIDFPGEISDARIDDLVDGLSPKCEPLYFMLDEKSND